MADYKTKQCKSTFQIKIKKQKVNSTVLFPDLVATKNIYDSGGSRKIIMGVAGLGWRELASSSMGPDSRCVCPGQRAWTISEYKHGIEYEEQQV